jgi:hypothetical protein
VTHIALDCFQVRSALKQVGDFGGSEIMALDSNPCCSFEELREVSLGGAYRVVRKQEFTFSTFQLALDISEKLHGLWTEGALSLLAGFMRYPLGAASTLYSLLKRIEVEENQVLDSC